MKIHDSRCCVATLLLALCTTAATAAAGTPFMLKDILPDSGGSMGKVLHVDGGTVYFFADNGTSTGLWKSDGTPDGTVLLRADLPAPTADYPVEGFVGGSLLFTSGGDLWKTDGTPGGTVLVKDFITVGWANASGSVVVGSTLFFMANDGDGAGYELWKSDGTPTGTALVKDINSGSSSSNPIHFAAMGGKAYFAADDSTNGNELWKSDGTSTGTVMVKNINTLDCANYECGSYPDNLTTVGTKVYFSAETPNQGRELWVTDGTTSNTTLVEDINPSVGVDSNPRLLIANGNALYFVADDGTHGQELWRSDDGTAANTYLVADTWTGATWNHGLGSTTEDAMAVMGGDLYFQATDALNNHELWKTGAGGTVKVKEIASPGESNPGNFAVVGDTLYFSADDGASGVELWMSQGTEATTVRVADINSGAGGSSPSQLVAGTERIFFAATDGSHGSEPWVLHTETVEPTDPSTLASSTHTPGTWSGNNQITVQWSGASDAGSGVQGYSVVFDTTSDTIPDQTVDVDHTSDPHHTTSASLADGQNHYFHLRTCDWAGNCTSTEHLGPFWIETHVPAGPSALSSTSHTVNVWSANATVNMQWSGASDSGSGMQGYSVLFDTNATTDPGTTVDVAHGSDPHTYSETLSQGTYWFHLRACDAAGNCSAPQHAGPYKIDGAAPSNPSSLASTSHTAGQWSNDPSITMQWSGASDAGSGVAGYSVLVDTNSSTEADASIEVAHIDGISVHSWTSAELGNGNSYYFHLRTCDTAGVCAATVHKGPYMIDVSPPTDPTSVSSTSHTISTWSNEAQVDMVWSGASAAPYGSPLDGYKVKFNSSPTDWTPGTEHWVDHGPSPSYTGTLAEGAGQYFHLKTCDEAGNCTSAVHLGPFQIDLTTPSAPSFYESTSHESGVWSSVTRIALEWSGAADTGGSDLAGYSVSCDTTPTGVPDLAIEVDQSGDPHSYTSDPLADGSDWYCHIRSCDWAGSCADPVHLGPFSIESTPPTNPTVTSTSHEASTWSSDNQIGMQWQGASDAGSGVAGYSFEFSTSSDTVPDTTVDLDHGTDPHSTTSGALSDGNGHWFHLRTCDTAGNCSDAVHKGPYFIDTQAPTDPTISSSSHTIGAWSSDATVDISWSGATNGGAGSALAGYSYLFDTTADTLPDTEIDRQHLSEGTYWETSDPLADGASHYFHLRTTDWAGNWTGGRHFGPIKIDTQAPATGAMNVHSTSHTVGVESYDPTIDMAWTAATDGGSGLGGYWQYFGHSSTATCGSQNLDSAETGITSSTLTSGSWYFHICAIDAVNNRSEILTTGPFVIVSDADLSVAIVDSPDPVLPGEDLVYTVTVHNNGPSAATVYDFSFPLPDGVTPVSTNPGNPTCEIYSDPETVSCSWMDVDLSSGASWQVTIAARVEAWAVAPLLANVTLDALVPDDTNPSNNTAQVSTSFPDFGDTDMAVSATAYPDPASPGASLTYTVTVANEGPAWADGVYLFHVLPPETTFSSSLPDAPDCTAVDHGTEGVWFGCELGYMGPAETKTVTLTLGLDSAYGDDWLLGDFSVDSDQADPVPGNNDVQVSVAVGPGPEVPLLPCEVRPFDDTNESSFGAAVTDNPREYCTRLMVPLTDGPFDCRWDGDFYVTDIGTRWASTGAVSQTTPSFLVRIPDGGGEPGPVAGSSYLDDVPTPQPFPGGDYLFSGRYASASSNREALGSATGYEVWACHQTVGAATQNLVTTADLSAETQVTPCRTSADGGSFADCADNEPTLRAIGISARFAGIAGAGDPGQVVPPATAGSSAVFRAYLHRDADILRVEIEHDVANPTAVHLHSGAAGENGPIIFDFPDPASPIAVDGIALSPEDLLALADGRLYVDIHSAAHPEGEVRGKLVPAHAARIFSDGFESGDTSAW